MINIETYCGGYIKDMKEGGKVRWEGRKAVTKPRSGGGWCAVQSLKVRVGRFSYCGLGGGTSPP
jgi:hypothetical protein